MSAAPERLNMRLAVGWYNFGKELPDDVEYIRADIHDAEVDRLHGEVGQLKSVIDAIRALKE
jgi:hypothetical protein